jgi:putative transposase
MIHTIEESMIDAPVHGTPPAGALKDKELARYLDSLQLDDRPPGAPKLTKKGREYVERVRKSPPSRTVRGGHGNRSGRYPSQKMGVTIQFESATVELPNIILWEFDPHVLEFWDQPEQIKVSFTLPDGKKQSHWITPDFLLLEGDKCGWIECKKEEELIRLAEEKPYLFSRTEDGVWHYLPGEEKAKEYGLFYRVSNSAAINPVLVGNLDYLSDYFLPSSPPVPKEAVEAITAAVRAKPGIRLSELIDKCPELKTDHFNALIAHKSVYADLGVARLANQKQNVRVFCDHSQAAAFQFLDQCKTESHGAYQVHLKTELQFAGRKLVVEHINEDELLMHSDDGEVRMPKANLNRFLALGEMRILTAPPPAKAIEAYKRLALYTPEETAVAMQRLRILQGLEPSWKLPSERQIRRWRARYREAENGEFGCGLLGLYDRYENCGKGSSNISEATLGLLTDAFTELYLTSTAITPPAFYSRLLKLADSKLIDPPCKPFVYKWLEENKTWLTEQLRIGKRGAYKIKPPVPPSPGFPPGAERPWQRVHIDHTQCDIELRLTEDRATVETERPWLSVMVDDYSRKVLAFVILFDPPSYRTCMLLLRACVERHGHVPEVIVVDNGPDFKGSYFQPLAGALHIRLEYRPPAEPKYGKPVERWFGTANTLFFHQLLGNTKLMKNPREVTKSVDPSKLAVWNLEALYDALNNFCYELYNNKRVHQTLGTTPDKRFDLGRQLQGERHGRDAYATFDFKILTMPTTDTGTARITKDGVKVMYFWYYSEEFASHVGESIPVRYDPYDVRKIYFRLGAVWHTAPCAALAHLDGFTERQLKILSQELRQQQRAHGQKVRVTQQAMGEFYESTDGQEALLIQIAKDRALAGIQAKKGPNGTVKNQTGQQPVHAPGDVFQHITKRPLRKLKQYVIESSNEKQ